jgi:hypothetical protein
MRFLPFTLVLAILSGCATNPVPFKPIEAQIPELRFSYAKDGNFKVAYGHAADHFKEGEPKIIKVKVNKKGGDCKLRLIDGDRDFTKDCTGLSEVVLDLGTHYEGEPDVIGLSVSQENLGIQQGFLYTLLRKERDALPVSFRCPYNETVSDLAVCTRPASYAFKVKITVEENLPGELLETLWCNDGTSFDKVLPITGAEEKWLEFTVRSPTFCVLGLGLRQDKRPDGTHRILKGKTIFLRFYNPMYIPLGVPELGSVAGVRSVCAAEDYNAHTIYGKDGGRINKGACVDAPKSFEFLAWDSYGRFTFKIEQTKYSKRKKPEGWEFYENIKPWVYQNMKKCLNEACVISEYERLSKHPQMVQAVELWDSSVLYTGG